MAVANLAFSFGAITSAGGYVYWLNKDVLFTLYTGVL